jgi:hypothetical protein
VHEHGDDTSFSPNNDNEEVADDELDDEQAGSKELKGIRLISAGFEAATRFL